MRDHQGNAVLVRLNWLSVQNISGAVVKTSRVNKAVEYLARLKRRKADSIILFFFSRTQTRPYSFGHSTRRPIFVTIVYTFLRAHA